MQSIKKVKSKKKLIIVLALVLLVITGGVYVWFTKPFQAQQQPEAPSTTRPVNSVDYSPATEEEKQAANEAKERIAKEQEQQQNPQPPAATPITVTIVRASQPSAGQPLAIRTSIDGAKSGTCNATLTRNGHTVTGNGTITFSATSYSCNIDIPAQSFNEAGQWQLSVVAKSDATTSQAATQEVTITK